jgi:DNA-binding transcriptional regulator GbsR (MarR family)
VVANALSGSVGGTDVDDILQEVALSSWMAHENGERCTPSFWASKARWLTIDHLRRHRRVQPIPEFWDVEDPRMPCPTMARQDVVALLGPRLGTLVCRGYTLTEIAKETGVSKATVSRVVAKVKEMVMSHKLRIKEFGIPIGDTRKFRVYQGDVWVASVVMCKETREVVMRARNVDVSVEDINSVLDAAYTSKPDVNEVRSNNAELGSAGTLGSSLQETEDMKRKKKEAKKASAAKARAKKSAIPAGFLCGDVKGDDFPPTLEKWAEMCGGVGNCLGGSGFKVKARFKPGWDAKLKSALKQKGTDNAKALADQLGWLTLIRWG